MKKKKENGVRVNSPLLLAIAQSGDSTASFSNFG
jgi:hypothetical protein